MLAIVGCSQLITLRGGAGPRTGPAMRELGIVENGAVLIEGDAIVEAGPAAALRIPPVCEVIDAQGRVVMPGFIDAHTHPVFATPRGAEMDVASGRGGIPSTVRRTRAATEEQLFQSAKLRAARFLRCGTTTIEAKSGFGLTLADELKLLRVIRRLDRDGVIRTVPTFLGAYLVPEEYRARRSDYVDLVSREMLPKVAAERLAEYCDVFCEPEVFSVAECRQVLDKARFLGLGLRIHADQFSDSNGAALAAELGAATADHLECTDAAGLAGLHDTGVQPVLLPASVYALNSGVYADARAMVDDGMGVVLATGFNPGSSPTPSMTMVLSLAATQMNMTIAEGITAATVNAAHSLGRGDRIGSIEAGKLADIVIHDCRDYRELGYCFGVEHAWRVFIGGRQVFSRDSSTPF